jgi:hypothetical protein
MELSRREQRAIMLETQIPAYARTADGRRAIDLIYKRARNLDRALPVGIKTVVRSVIPHQHKNVSGLNVPSNFQTVVGRWQENKFSYIQKKALRALEARNAN